MIDTEYEKIKGGRKMKLLFYCTKAKYGFSVGHLRFNKNDLTLDPDTNKYRCDDSCYIMCAKNEYTENNFLNGKIVAECDCEKVEYFEMEYHHDNQVLQSISKHDLIESEEWGEDCFKRIISNENTDEEISNCYLLKESCLSFDELGDYVCPKNGINDFYVLHLSNLKIFDKLKKLNDYGLKKAPMNMCFKRYPVPYDNELGGWEIDRETIIISVRPEHLCKILNGEKTIEVRKQILKELKKEVISNDQRRIYPKFE